MRYHRHMYRFIAFLTVLWLLATGVTTATSGQHDRTADANEAKRLQQRFERGDGDAALRLGNLLAQGRIDTTVYGKPLDWYRRGCDLRDMSSCHNVALSYHYGRAGLAVDHAAAVEHYEKAASLGFINSMYNLAQLYAGSDRIVPNPAEGLKWMLLAQLAARQYPHRPLCQIIERDPQALRQTLESRISAIQRREVYEAAMNWRPQILPANAARP
jgi:TPR repeat protein